MGSLLVSKAVDRHLAGGGFSDIIASMNTPTNTCKGDVNTCLHQAYCNTMT